MTISFSIDEVENIIDVLDSTASMMEPYYSQCNGQYDAYSLIEELRNKLPYIHIETTIFPANCKICGVTFEKSKRGKIQDTNGQNSAVMNHLITVHGIEDYKERRKLVQHCIEKTTRVEYKTKAEFLANRKR